MSAWPHFDLPGAGPLGEHELDAACWRKRAVVLTQDQCRAVDDTAGLCGTCGGHCATPQACEQPEPPRVVDTLRRQRAITAWLAITLGAVICGVSLVGYFASVPEDNCVMNGQVRVCVVDKRAAP